MRGDTEAATREARSLIEQFSENEQAMKDLSNQAADLGHAELTRELLAIAKAAGFETEIFVLLRLEALIASGAYAEASKLAERIINEETWSPGGYRPMLRALQTVARCGVEGSGGIDEDLKALLLNASFGPATFTAIARRMEGVNCAREAIMVLEAGLKRFPESGGLGASLSRLSAER